MTTDRPASEVLESVRPISLRPHAVILHNDDVNSMEHVVASLLACVPELDQARVAAITLEAHTKGRAVVILCPLELAELYRERLEARGLTVTIDAV